jgi:ketosteroid isomerase-like protein
MKPLVAVGLVLAMLPVFQQAQADTSGVEQTVTQLERDWAQAGIKADIGAMDKLIAHDWVGIDFMGNKITKAEIIADAKSGASKTQSEDIGPITVRVFGNTAVVTASDTEKSSYKGKDSSGKYVWTDVWVMRDGHWQVVASQSIKTG